MEIQTSKLELIQLIMNLDDSQLLNQLINLLKSNTEELSPETKEELFIGLKQLKDGKRISVEDFLEGIINDNDDKIKLSFGAWQGDESAEEIISNIKNKRN